MTVSELGGGGGESELGRNSLVEREREMEQRLNYSQNESRHNILKGHKVNGRPINKLSTNSIY